MKRFVLFRKVDESGISGPGEVLDGVVFDDGSTVVKWRISRSFGHGVSNIAIFDRFEDFLTVHVESHESSSNEVRFIDKAE